MTDTYALASIINGRRFYWSSTKPARWAPFADARHYSRDERAAVVKLPDGAFWVSILHGMGQAPYAADSVLEAGVPSNVPPPYTGRFHPSAADKPRNHVSKRLTRSVRAQLRRT